MSALPQGNIKGWAQVQRQVIGAAVNTVDFISAIDSSSGLWRLTGHGITVVTDNTTLIFRLGVGGTIDTGGNYNSNGISKNGSGALIESGTEGTTNFPLSASGAGEAIGNNTSEVADFIMYLHNPSSANFKKINGIINFDDSIATSRGATSRFGGSFIVTSAVDSIRLQSSGGNMDAGVVTLEKNINIF